MTGLTETEHLVAALEAGGVDYVTKPIKPREVMARMGVHLRQRAMCARARWSAARRATRSTPSATPPSPCARATAA
jgi:DNA-binding response OmpR family regulator